MRKPMKFANSMIFSAHCPFCGKVFDYTLYPEIHGIYDPDVMTAFGWGHVLEYQNNTMAWRSTNV